MSTKRTASNRGTRKKPEPLAHWRRTTSTRKVPHPFLKERGAKEFWMVIRLDDYRKAPELRGQFYATGHDPRGGLWPTKAQAVHAAEWAMRQSFGGDVYGILKLTTIVEKATQPTRTVDL